tara:strand:+ start:360 stop:578 length:219 start_codon:yes stop_codon:yes gene_type:complete
MVQKIKLNDKEFEVEDLSEKARGTLSMLQFSTNRIQELENMQALLQRARNSYVDSLKKEVLSDKAGLLFGDE